MADEETTTDEIDTEDADGDEKRPSPSPSPPSSSPSPSTTITSPSSSPRSKYRRLHTLSGALALGAFLIEHLLTNASALGGEARFESIVGAIERSSLLAPIEIIFILVPLGFHIGYGLKLLREKSAADIEIDRYGDRRLWVMQRLSGTIVLGFVLIHFWELRIQKLFFGAEPRAFYTILTAHLSWTWAGVPWMALLYLVGIAATTFHFSNGFFAATRVWGVWQDRRRARIVSSTVGVILFLIGGATVVSIATGTRLLPAPDADSAPCGTITAAPKAPEAPAPAPPSR